MTRRKTKTNDQEEMIMKLWGGRFTKQTDALAFAFNESLSFDQRLYRQDIAGSMAHVRMLAKQGILTEDERDQILAGLTGIRDDLAAGRDPGCARAGYRADGAGTEFRGT